MAGMLAEDGKLCLRDVVYSFDPGMHEKYLSKFLAKASERSGPWFASIISDHVRNEYSTMDWIMQGMIEREGFKIERAKHNHGFFALYLCTRNLN
jgi:putative AdoMet-dependent methyltransferase